MVRTTTTSPEDLAALAAGYATAASEAEQIRLALAQDQRTAASGLEALAGDVSPAVRVAVAAHTNTPPRVLRGMLRGTRGTRTDIDVDVLIAAAANPAAAPEDLFDAAAEENIGDPERSVALLGALATNPASGIGALDRIASHRDTNDSVRAAAAAHPNASPDLGGAEHEPAGRPATLTLLLVGDDGTFREAHATTADSSEVLSVCQALVDGLMQPIDTTIEVPGDPPERHTADIWLNEEGKLRSDFAVNPHAFALLAVPFNDVFVGPAFLAATADDGYMVSLTPAALGAAKQHLRDLGATELPPAPVAEAAAQQAAARTQRVAAGFTGHGYTIRGVDL